MTAPDLSHPAYIEAVKRVFDSGVFTEGEQVDYLETAFAKWLTKGSTHSVSCVAVSNGTAALQLALMCYGIGRGHRVAVPAFTFTATALAVIAVGAEPVFVDVSQEDFCMDPSRLAQVGKVDAVIPVHLDGVPANIPAIEEMVGPGVPIIEDSCPTFGSSRNGIKAGTSGWCSAFSFNQTKICPAGEGGILVFNKAPEMARMARNLRRFGEISSMSSLRRQSLWAGNNFKMPEMIAAIARVSIDHLPRRQVAAIENCRLLDAACDGSDILFPAVRPDGADKIVRHKYRARIKSGKTRKEIENILSLKGVPISRSEVIPLPRHELFSHHDGRWPVAESIIESTILIGSRQQTPWEARAFDVEAWCNHIINPG